MDILIKVVIVLTHLRALHKEGGLAGDVALLQERVVPYRGRRLLLAVIDQSVH